MQPAPQDNQLMSKHRVLSFKPQLRLEWRGQDGQNETEQPDHSASLGDSITSSTRIRFSVHTHPTGSLKQNGAKREPSCRAVHLFGHNVGLDIQEPNSKACREPPGGVRHLTILLLDLGFRLSTIVSGCFSSSNEPRERRLATLPA
jgi:hypothetical protein